MHPAMVGWWKSHAHRHASAHCAPPWAHFGGGQWSGPWQGGCDDGGGGDGGGFQDGGGGGGGFGVRRPLRFLAYKLQLDERQVTDLARILDELKTERAQAEVDRRRTLTAFADAVSAAAFDEARAGEGATLRVQSAERLRDAVVGALRRIHALLDQDQREKLAYLIRTGTLVL